MTVSVSVSVAEPVSGAGPVAMAEPVSVTEHMAVPVKVWVLFVKVCFQEALAVVNFTK